MITVIIGTNRVNSVSRQVALQYQKLLAKHGQESNLIDLADLPTDFMSTALYENQGTNAHFNPTLQLMRDSNKFAFIVPEYNGSFPGVLKLFLDGLDYPDNLRGKKGGLIGLSSGVQGGVMAMSHLTDIFNYLGMHVMANKPKLMGINKKLKGGEIADEFFVELLENHAKDLINF